jgi:hypothetical protein
MKPAPSQPVSSKRGHPPRSRLDGSVRHQETQSTHAPVTEHTPRSEQPRVCARSFPTGDLAHDNNFVLYSVHRVAKAVHVALAPCRATQSCPGATPRFDLTWSSCAQTNLPPAITRARQRRSVYRGAVPPCNCSLMQHSMTSTWR